MKASVLAVALAGLSLGVDAAGLGKLTVLSGLGQPLRAEIEISATKAELSSMNARLAPPETFKQAGVEFMSAIAGVKFDIAKRRNGKPYLKLSSDRAVNEPFLDMLIQLDWAQGRLVREYTFLLDPPEALVARKQVAPVSTAESATAAALARGKQSATPSKGGVPGTREVKRGDVLRAIADDVKPEGVTVDQMLVAIFRANKDAFIKDNMNRMRTGAILTIPDRDAVAAIERKEALREVRAQAASFNAYRRRVAEAASAAEAPAEDAAQQAASGKITPRVEEKAPAVATEPTDQLKVSKSEAAAKGGKAEQASQNRIATLQEEVVAKEKALKDATSRLAELEKNVTELQKLVELKNQSMAELQRQASAKASLPEPKQPEAKQPEAKQPEAKQPEAKQPEPKQPEPKQPEPKQPEATSPAAATTTPPAPAVSTPPTEKAPEVPAEPITPAQVAAAPAAVQVPPMEETKPEPPKPEEAKKLPAEESGFVDGMLVNPLAVYGGGGLLAALLALFGYRALQRRKEDSPAPTTLGDGSAQSVFGATGGQSIDTSASSIQTDFSHSGMAAIDADEGVDPVAEADVYMAYGRDAQAEEILLDALKNEPTRHAIQVKLLEIYAQRKSLKQFETLAGELYAQTGGVGGEWEKAAAMGRKLDPTNPLYGGKSGDEAPVSEARIATAVGTAAVAAGAAALTASSPSVEPQDAEADKLRDTWAMPSELNRIDATMADAGDDATTIVVPEGKAPEAAVQQGVADDFNLDLPELDTAPAPKADAVEPSGLDFDLGLDIAPSDTSAPREADQEPASALQLDPGIDEKAAPTAEEAVDVAHVEGSDHEKTDAFSGTESMVTRSVIDFDMGDAAEPETTPSHEDAQADVPVMDLERTDVAGTLIDFNLDELTASKPVGDVGVMDLERTDVGGNLLDFNFELEQGAAKDQASTESPATLDLSGINLDLPGPASSDAAPEAAPTAGESTAAAGEQEDVSGAEGENAEAATKIDLAKAYEEMGDQEGARELLEEVLHDGSTAQQEKARAMLASLGR